jgi:hypothetical protein
MVIGLTITGVSAILFLYLGYRDWQHSKLPSPESAYVKYSSPELYIVSILGIFTGIFIAFGLKVTVIVILVLLPVCYLLLKLLSPYFDSQ